MGDSTMPKHSKGIFYVAAIYSLRLLALSNSSDL